MTTAEIIQRPDDSVEAAPLTTHQQFLCIFDAGNEQGPFGPMYHVVGAWRLHGEVDVVTLQAALDDVVARHESLRTVVVRDQENPQQKVSPPCSPELAVRDLSGCAQDARHRRAEELYNEVEADTNSVTNLPLIRAVLGRFDEQDSVLVLNVHHTAADAWSMDRIMQDLLSFYTARRDRVVADLPEVVQYREYARYEQERLNSPAITAAREYWQGKLQGARVTAIPTDRPRSTPVPKKTTWIRFAIDRDVASAAVALSNEMKSSPFMVLFAAYQVLLRDLTKSTDIVVPTFTPGRAHARFHDTVGSFINFLPLRTDLSGCDTIRDVIVQTRTTCLEAYSRDIPFIYVVEGSPELMLPAMGEHHQVSAFQVIRTPNMAVNERAGEITYSKIWQRSLSQAVGSDVPDGILWTLHIGPDNGIVGSLGFNTNRFDAVTMSALLDEFKRVLRTTVTAPDSPLPQL